MCNILQQYIFCIEFGFLNIRNNLVETYAIIFFIIYFQNARIVQIFFNYQLIK